MGKNDVAELHKKLDYIMERNDKAYNIIGERISSVREIVVQLEEHQRSINGTVARLQSEAINRNLGCSANFEKLDKRINNNKGSIIFARGFAYSFGFIATLLSLIAISKSFGLW